MNEKLQEELLKIVANINTGTKTAWGFLTEHTPDVIGQLLLWHGVYSFVLFLIGFLGSVIILIWVLYFLKNITTILKDYNLTEQETKIQARAIMGGILSFFSLCCFIICMNIEWLKIWIAPKVWLLEYIAGLVK